MKDPKEARLEVRLTNREKNLIKEYAANHNLTMSEAVRSLVIRVFTEDKTE